ncbi:MAG: GMP synthase subunit A [Thermoplasmata archaeon]|nr:GMP synthase subunit A [Thermoplasmata archaeon]
MKIPVIDNGGQWTHREWRVLRDLDVDSRIVPNTTPFAELDADGVVLSGGALSLEGSDTPLGRVSEWINTIDVPVLGICVGHQYLARQFGGTVRHSGQPEFGRVQVSVDAPDHPLFAGLPATFQVWESHNDDVIRLPEGWRGLAHSASCPVQAMAHPTRPIMGLQFHPEVEHTEGGREIFRHFIDLCRK